MKVRSEFDIGVARPSAAAFGEEDDGQAGFLRDAEHPILLLMIFFALSTRQNSVVVGHHHAARVFFGE